MPARPRAPRAREAAGDLRRRAANWADLHRWPWPVWRLRGGADLVIGGERFFFEDAAAPELSF